jgi:hypothetical protein
MQRNQMLQREMGTKGCAVQKKGDGIFFFLFSGGVS